MLWVGAPDDFVLVEAQAERVIALARPRFPEWFLSREHCRKSVRVGQEPRCQRRIDQAPARLISEQLAHRDALFALLGELRPVGRHRCS